MGGGSEPAEGREGGGAGSTGGGALIEASIFPDPPRAPDVFSHQERASPGQDTGGEGRARGPRQGCGIILQSKVNEKDENVGGKKDVAPVFEPGPAGTVVH